MGEGGVGDRTGMYIHPHHVAVVQNLLLTLYLETVKRN